MIDSPFKLYLRHIQEENSKMMEDLQCYECTYVLNLVLVCSYMINVAHMDVFVGYYVLMG